jgi:hypothetical protein
MYWSTASHPGWWHKQIVEFEKPGTGSRKLDMQSGGTTPVLLELE